MVVDHFSRLVVGFAIFPKQPSALEVCDLLDRVVEKVGRSQKYIITDQDSIFTGDVFKKWCQRKSVNPRFGADQKSLDGYRYAGRRGRRGGWQ